MTPLERGIKAPETPIGKRLRILEALTAGSREVGFSVGGASHSDMGERGLQLLVLVLGAHRGVALLLASA